MASASDLRDNGELCPASTASRRRDDVIVAADEPIVVCELVFAVCSDEGGLVCRVAGVSAEHGEQRDADPSHPLTVRWTCAVEFLERISSRVEDQLDGVDERAVEVEQDSWAPRPSAGLPGSHHGYRGNEWLACSA
jgi:hypothetical protein